MNADVERLCKAAEAQGWAIRRGTKHIQMIPPTKTGEIVTIGHTPSCDRAILNTTRRMQRADPNFQPPKGK